MTLFDTHLSVCFDKISSRQKSLSHFKDNWNSFSSYRLMMFYHDRVDRLHFINFLSQLPSLLKHKQAFRALLFLWSKNCF